MAYLVVKSGLQTKIEKKEDANLFKSVANVHGFYTFDVLHSILEMSLFDKNTGNKEYQIIKEKEAEEKLQRKLAEEERLFLEKQQRQMKKESQQAQLKKNKQTARFLAGAIAYFFGALTFGVLAFVQAVDIYNYQRREKEIFNILSGMGGDKHDAAKMAEQVLANQKPSYPLVIFLAVICIVLLHLGIKYVHRHKVNEKHKKNVNIL